MTTNSVPQFASLYVGDLHNDVTEAMLYEIFNSVGPVASIRVCRDSVTRRSLGYGYVNYHNVSDADRALDTLNYSSIKGRSCRIMWSQRDPSLRKSGTGNIYVKNLDRNIDNKALFDTFGLFGNILSCKVAADSVGQSCGYGFVHYETEEAAKQAIERVDGMQIGEKTVRVTEFVKRSERELPNVADYTNLYVKNFPQGWDEAKLTEVFGEHGKITSTALRTDNRGREFAFVNFESSDDAQKCVEAMHKKDMRTEEQIQKEKEEGKEEEEVDVDGHPLCLLYVQRAQTRHERQIGVNLYVKNLDEDIDEAGLRALFEPFGTLRSAAAPKDERGRCKGFGFVCFVSPDEATRAVNEMHLRYIKGKPLYVGLAEKREARQERLRQQFTLPEGGASKGTQGCCKGAGMGGGKPLGRQHNRWLKTVEIYHALKKNAPVQACGGKGGDCCQGGMMPQGGFFPPDYMDGGGAMPQQMVGGGPPNGCQGMGMRPQGAMMMPQQQAAAAAAAMYQQRAAMMPGAKGAMMGQQMNPQMMGMMGMMSMMGKGGCPGMMGKGGMMGMMGAQMGAGMGGMMRPPMSMQPGQQAAMHAGMPPQQQQQQPQQPSGQGGPSGLLNASALAAATPVVQKQMIGEKLFQAISKHQPELAGKITGMMLEMDNSELLLLLESDQQMKVKVDEALHVLGASK